jgi:hypothetical protein
MVHRGQKDQADVAPDPTRDRALPAADDTGDVTGSVTGDVAADVTEDDALGWDEQVPPSRLPQWPVLRLWLRALPVWVLGVVLVTAATAWPWLLLMGWLHRGGPYFWWFGLGCVLVVALTWLRFLDERALRAVSGIRGPSPQRERALADAPRALGRRHDARRRRRRTAAHGGSLAAPADSRGRRRLARPLHPHRPDTAAPPRHRDR